MESNILFEEENYIEPVKILVASHMGMRTQAKPHKDFKNWYKYFKLPWFFFLDLSVVILYIIFAYFHESSTIVFAHDLSQAIDKFFISDLGISDPPIGIPLGDGQLFFIDDFINMVDNVSSRLFIFPNTFPILHPIQISTNVKMLITMYDSNEILHFDIDQSESSEASKYIIPYIGKFSSVSISMTYHLMFVSEIQDTRINLRIFANFVQDPSTDAIWVTVSHTRFQEKFKISFNMLFNIADYSLPICIAVLNLILILITIYNLTDLINFSKGKSSEVGIKATLIFWRKFDKWNLFTLFSHTFSLITCIIYIFIGQDIEQELPPVSVLLSISTCCICLLLIRYLRLRRSIMLVIEVLYKSLIELIQFIIGCLPIFFSFWVFGICFWGHLSEEFASPLQAASFLFCVMHGDSILGFFDNTIIQNDYSPYFGFFYSCFWVSFGLLLMFNITISIVSNVLDRESEELNKYDDYIEPDIGMLTSDLSLITSRIHTY